MLKAAYQARRSELAAEVQEQQRLTDQARALAEEALEPATRREAAEIAGITMARGEERMGHILTTGIETVSTQLSELGAFSHL